MDRNILNDLINMLNEPGPINWTLAEQVAGHITGSRTPVDPWLAEEYVELSRLAVYQVESNTTLRSRPDMEIFPTDSAGWAHAHLRAFRYLVEPLAQREDFSGPQDMQAVLQPLRPVLFGMQMGTVVGSLGLHTLGLFDAGLPTADPSPIGLVTSNIESFAVDHSLDPRQVRLWILFQETIRDAILSRPWVRPHFLKLMEEMLAETDLDAGLMGLSPEVLNDPERIGELLSGQEANFMGPIPTPVAGPALEAVLAFAAILDGYGDYITTRLGEKMLPDLPAITNAMRARHLNQEPPAKTGQVLMLPGLEPEAGQFGTGAQFCADVAQRWGIQSLDKVWESPGGLPTFSELTDTVGWAARVLLDDTFPPLSDNPPDPSFL